MSKTAEAILVIIFLNWLISSILVHNPHFLVSVEKQQQRENSLLLSDCCFCSVLGLFPRRPIRRHGRSYTWNGRNSNTRKKATFKTEANMDQESLTKKKSLLAVCVIACLLVTLFFMSTFSVCHSKSAVFDLVTSCAVEGNRHFVSVFWSLGYLKSPELQLPLFNLFFCHLHISVSIPQTFSGSS